MPHQRPTILSAILLLLCACSPTIPPQDAIVDPKTENSVELKIVNGSWGLEKRSIGFFARGTKVAIHANSDQERGFVRWHGPVADPLLPKTTVELGDQVGNLVVVRAELRSHTSDKTDAPASLDRGFAHGGLQISPRNSRVLVYEGKPTPLFGSRNNYYGQDLGEIERDFRHRAKLGLNQFRIWSDFRNFNTEQPWLPVSGVQGINGSPKLDLTKENDAYFQRAKQIVELAKRYDIIIHWMVFDEIELEGARHRWGRNPFNPGNNVNHLGLRKRNGTKNGPGGFFDLENAPLLAIQRAHVERLVRELAPVGNVIFAVMNESTASYEWEIYWVRLIRSLGGIVLTNSFSEEQRLIASPALDAFAFHNIPPRAVNKTFLQYYASGKHLTYEEQATRPAKNDLDLLHIIWGSLLAMGSYSFDEISKNLEIKERAEILSGHASSFYRTLVQDFESLQPANQLIRKGGGYAATNPNNESIFFFTQSELQIRLPASDESSSLTPIWFDPLTGIKRSGELVQLNHEFNTFQNPFSGAAVLYLSH